MWTKRAGVEISRDWFLVFLVGAVLLVRGVYVLSYPFLIEGDGATYYELLLQRQAHLLHATGYIFFSLPVTLIAKVVGTEPANLLPYVQQAVSIASVTALYLALKRLLPRWISFLTCLPLGIDAQMVAAAGTTRPEFLQADILMLLISSTIFGLTCVGRRAKTIFYVGTGVLGVAGYLTKYNFVPVLVFCLVPLVDRGLQGKARWWTLGKSGLGATLFFIVFVATFHYPTTGSWRLNLEHGWIHIMKLGEASIPLLPANGIATQKYIVLSESLPPMGAGPGPWKTIDEVPEAVRGPFRQKWSPLLADINARDVHAALATVEKRRTNYHHPDAFMPIYYYLGLEETEKLLSDVYWEGVRGYPWQYVIHICRALIQNADFAAVYRPYLPVAGLYGPTDFPAPSRTEFLPAPARPFKVVDWSVAKPEELADFAASVWRPATTLFSFLAFIKYIPTSCLWIVLLSGLILIPVSFARERRFRRMEVLLVLTATALLGEMSFAAVLFVFRAKELILCQPLIYLLIGLSVALLVKLTSAPRQPI
jgi:hypothetical protein